MNSLPNSLYRTKDKTRQKRKERRRGLFSCGKAGEAPHQRSMTYQVAIASTDGIVINQHFGHANQFHIVELDSDTLTYRFVESRPVQPVCQMRDHDDAALDAVIETLRNVQAVLVSKIGQGASAYLESRGMAVYEAPFLLNAVLEKILNEKLWEVDKWPSHTKS